MAADQTRKYKFLSPSVQDREIDLTRRPTEPDEIGAVVIGRSERGPSFTPIRLNDEGEFIETFGKPIPGGGTLNNDVWRDGNYSAPTYGAYAAYAYLRNKGPVTFVRLAGDQHTNATTSGAAGWPQDGLFTPATTVASNAGAYGLFLINSASAQDYALNNHSSMTGALGAIFYLREGASIRLAGTTAYGTDTTNDELSGSGQPILSSDVNKTFTAVVVEGTTATTASFNFQPDSDKFIRKVFNTNPILTNSDIISTTSQNYRKYWLGQSYEDFVDRQVTSGSVSGSVFGVIVPLASGSGNAHGGDYRFAGKRAKTGWVISQDLTNNYGTYLPQNMTKLFRFHSLTPSEWEQRNLKISISNIKSSKNLSNQYGTFDVEIRMIDDNDKSKKVVERYTNCNLNPDSNDYIAKKIGDVYWDWDYSARKWIEYGDYVNRSKFVYVEVPTEVAESLTDPRLLPFGFYGTPRFKGVTMTRTSMLQTEDLLNGIVRPGNVFVRGTGSMPHAPSGSNFGGEGIVWGDASGGLLNLDTVSASFLFPAHPLVVSASDANTTSPFDAYFGVNVFRNGSSRIVAENHVDIVRALPENYDEDDTASVEVSHYFSLDDVRQSSASGAPASVVSTWYADAYYESGSRVIGKSITATGAVSPLATLATSSYESVLNAGFNKFTMPLYGGYEGLDVTEKEPFRNSKINGGTETTNYAFHSIQRALDSIADTEVTEHELAVIPGIYDETMTRKLNDVCEDRNDCLALIDLNGDYTPSSENTSDEATRRGDVDTTIDNLKNRGINSSFSAAFYPWVKIRDPFSNNTVDVPPSVVALGAIAHADVTGEPWDAPAGFNRGKLSDGIAGLSVINVKDKLSQKDRDKLYVENINPIAKFNNNEIVLMGQKTLQVTPSALDRINVRRLMLTVRKYIRESSKNLLFDQNVKTTWSRFTSRIEPYLRSIKARFGLSDYRLVLDETTTTPELIDRNVMYAQIYLKPARAIEFIAIDFILEPTGVSFPQ